MLQLLEDYKRKLKTINTLIGLAETDIEKDLERLTTKASCYRTFISELEREIASTILEDEIIESMGFTYNKKNKTYYHPFFGENILFNFSNSISIKDKLLVIFNEVIKFGRKDKLREIKHTLEGILNHHFEE